MGRAEWSAVLCVMMRISHMTSPILPSLGFLLSSGLSN